MLLQSIKIKYAAKISYFTEKLRATNNDICKQRKVRNKVIV